MAITVKTLRPLAEWIGNGKIQIEWAGGTVEDLIRHLIERAGPEAERELKGEDGSFDYVVSINGKVQRDFSAQIQDGDEIVFFLPMGGG